jgi:thymidylate synthase (FAD)
MQAELINHMGSDLTVVNAARVSFDKESEWVVTEGPLQTEVDYEARSVTEWRDKTYSLADRDKKLIRYLAKHDHFTPFTHCTITLRETVPIFVARQRFKHTVGFSYNEVSRRYVDDEPKFYTPDVWRKRAEDKKQGSSDENVSKVQCMRMGYTVDERYTDYLEFAGKVYQDMIDAGVAPEQARMVLPQSMYTSYYVTGSLAAFARAYNLRSKPDAQAEIRELAAQWNKIISPLFPESWGALTNAA